MPTWNPLVSKVTLPSGSTYNIKDGYVWGGLSQEEIDAYITQWGDNIGYYLAEILNTVFGNIYGINEDTNIANIDLQWASDAPIITGAESITDAIKAIAATIEDLTGGNAVVFKGVSTTALTDGGNENPTVNGTVITTKKAGDLYFAPTTEGADTGNTNDSARNEFIYGSDNKWHWLGNQLAELGALAYKSSASASYTPAGTVSQPTFTGAQSTVTISTSNVSSGANYTPAGTVTGGQLSLNTLSSTGIYTPQGTVTSSATLGATTWKSVYEMSANNNYTEAWLPKGVTQPTFTGTPATITVNGTPSGTVTQPTFTGTAATITTKGTPAGTVSTPTISVNTAGSTTNIKQYGYSSTSAMSGAATAAPGATAPSNAIVYCNYENETLKFNQIGYNTTNVSFIGSTSNVAVKTGDATYQASQPTFTGALLSSTASHTPGGTVSQPTFNGTAGSYTGSYTPAGTVSKPDLTTSNTIGRLYYKGNQAPTISSTFAGTPATITVSGTPTGSVATATFEGQPVKITGTVTPSGTVSQPSFSGTASTITVS